MSVITNTRVTTDPANSDALVDKHAALVTALQAKESGLTNAQLGRLNDTNWVAIWHWETAVHLKEARQNPRAEAAAAFALTIDESVEDLAVIDAI
ncbi:MAG: antibiotic biosynthesis monooxygenase [Stackebrandtia sp.]